MQAAPQANMGIAQGIKACLEGMVNHSGADDKPIEELVGRDTHSKARIGRRPQELLRQVRAGAREDSATSAPLMRSR